MPSINEDPISIFRDWFSEAKKTEMENPNAMTLATAGKGGRPSARMVLLKEVDNRGFVFYTNLNSPKARELKENPIAALVFYWKTLARQVRIEGNVEMLSDKEADTYHKSRPRLSQIGAWASKQSQPLEGRFNLEKRIAKYTAKYSFSNIPRPRFWSGFRVLPVSIEFWREEAFRMHDRRVYTRTGNDWIIENLYP